ncbi:MAG: purple acid phosphatase [Nitrososphaeraceae archaeon]|nr:purple acid phosphatase [Nitrososphaeraceae archaeon]
MLTLYQKIACIIGFSAIFLVVSSNILVNYEQTIQAKPEKDKPGKGQGKDKPGKGQGKNKNDNARDNQPKVEPKVEPNKIQVETDIYKGFAFDTDGNNVSKSFNFAAAGDFGCTSNTRKTVENMKKNDPELVLPLGDLSYQKSANCWFDIMSPLKNKIFITLGFHDVNDGQAKLDQFVKSFELDKPYYSFDYGKVHFLVMASESPFANGSDQYKFVKQDLEETTNKKDVNWIIVTSYKPFYSSPSKHTGEKELRSVYHPLFEKYGVDLVLHAHNHNYQRTYPISFNPNDGSEPIVKHNFTTDYNDHTVGTIFATIGTGGESFYPLDGTAPYMATQLDRFGFLNIEIDNGNPHTLLTGSFLDNTGSEIRDYFTIKKQIQTKDANISPNSETE